MNWFGNMRDKDGNLVNQDPETGVRYGVISRNSLDDFVLDEIFQNGEDLSYLEVVEEEKARLTALYKEQHDDPDNELTEEQIEELLEADLASFSDQYESFGEDTYRYETEEDGEKIVVQTSGESYLWVFKGPVVKARLCSPCYPNAGNLDEIDEENGYETYGLPKDWLRKEEK